MPTIDADDQQARLEIYKLIVEMADRMTARRAGANSFFLAVNAALATLVGLFGSSKDGDVTRFAAWGVIAGAAAGVVLAISWWMLLRYYRRLNGAKFDVINNIETRLPEQPYTQEWTILHPTEAAPPAKTKGRGYHHREATVIEQFVPWVFVGVYLVLGVQAWLSR